jgi:hypothetical protein
MWRGRLIWFSTNPFLTVRVPFLGGTPAEALKLRLALSCFSGALAGERRGCFSRTSSRPWAGLACVYANDNAGVAELM